MALFSLIAAIFLSWCSLHGGPERLVMFISGILLFETMSNQCSRKFPDGFGLVCWLLGMIAILVLPGSWIGLVILQDIRTLALRALILLITFYLLGLGTFSDPSQRSARFFSWTPIRYLGNMSYSYFLIHGLALQAFFLVYATLFQSRPLRPIEFWIGLPIAFILSIIPALILYLLVEHPLSIFPARLKNKS
jgi:peptidoglycan/LPS O-acetylase OafA/YrhL